MYLLCRETQLVAFRKPVDRKGGEKLVIVAWPTGITQLPYSGGTEDQPYLIMRYLLACLRGEQAGVSLLMKRR